MLRQAARGRDSGSFGIRVAEMQISAGLLAEAAERSQKVSPYGNPFAFDPLGALATPAPWAAVFSH
jgi:hypothetical protein